MKDNFMLVILVLLLLTTAHANTWYVHPDSALNSIQTGLDSCSANDTVLVAAGTYYENIVWPSTQGIDLISELGPDWTIIDGNGIGRVIEIITGVDSTTIINGFTIQKGCLYGGVGAGIYCKKSSPIITDNTITENSAFYGAGIYCDSCSPSLTYVIITGNTAEVRGGGVYCDSSSSTLTNVTISGNTGGTYVDGAGGGIYCRYSNPSLINVTIRENASYGAGFYPGRGGGIWCYASNPSLSNVTITENTASYGGGIRCHASELSLTNITMSGNSNNGIDCRDNSSLNLVNCILWNDTPQEIYIESGSVTTTYSDIQGGWPGEGNIDENPMFVSGPLSDYHLCPFTPSPCIDAGNPDPQYNDPEDPLNPGCAMWPALGTVRNDMGVYGGPGTESWVYIIKEYKPPQLLSTILHIIPNPFRDRVNIRFNLEHNVEDVVLVIYDVTGRMVKKFNHVTNQQIFWNGTDSSNRKLPSGVYLLTLQAGNYSATEKLLLIR